MLAPERSVCPQCNRPLRVTEYNPRNQLGVGVCVRGPQACQASFWLSPEAPPINRLSDPSRLCPDCGKPLRIINYKPEHKVGLAVCSSPLQNLPGLNTISFCELSFWVLPDQTPEKVNIKPRDVPYVQFGVMIKNDDEGENSPG